MQWVDELESVIKDIFKNVVSLIQKNEFIPC